MQKLIWKYHRWEALRAFYKQRLELLIYNFSRNKEMKHSISFTQTADSCKRFDIGIERKNSFGDTGKDTGKVSYWLKFETVT